MKLLQRLATLAGLFLLCASPSFATSISVQTLDLVDLTPAEDLWRYTYTLTAATIEADSGFMILFNPVDYEALSNPTPDSDPNPVATTDPSWDVLLFDPDLFFSADGVFDALALVDDPLNREFSVDVVRLTAGSPTSQPFRLYHLLNDLVIIDADGQTELDPGSTAVPEPGTFGLIATGVAAHFVRRRRQTTRQSA